MLIRTKSSVSLNHTNKYIVDTSDCWSMYNGLMFNPCLMWGSNYTPGSIQYLLTHILLTLLPAIGQYPP